MAVAEKRPATQTTSNLSAKEWTSYNKLLMQRFPVPKMIQVSAVSLLNNRSIFKTHIAL